MRVDVDSGGGRCAPIPTLSHNCPHGQAVPDVRPDEATEATNVRLAHRPPGRRMPSRVIRPQGWLAGRLLTLTCIPPESIYRDTYASQSTIYPHVSLNICSLSQSPPWLLYPLMAEAISVFGVAAAASSVVSLSRAIQTSVQILRLHDQQYNVRQLELDVRASLQKFQVWQRTWSGDEKHPDVFVEALWGVKGWTHLRRMLVVINETSRSIANYLQDLKRIEETKPRSRWKKAYRVIQAKQGPSSKMQQLQEWSTTLTRVVDELWIYSETVFDSLHGTLSLESKVSERDRLLHTALRSRPCSLELYSNCTMSTLNYSLEMDLLDSGFTDYRAPSTPSEASLPVYYHLVAQSREAHGNVQKMTIESVATPATLKLETDDVVIQTMEKLQLFKPTAGHGTTLVKVAARGSAQSSYLRIPQRYIQPVNLKSNPESLDKVLDRLQSADLSTKEHLSTGAKVELAYKVIECGFFLLGTPWFASLSSKNLLRLKNIKKAHHSFCLETQTLDLEDLLYDDPGALAETSQLFRLGVLLMEIALDKPGLYTRSDETGQEEDRISKLPLVEQSMGAQYCKATAFCLQYRQSGKPFKGNKLLQDSKSSKDDKPFREAEKYEDPNFDDWQDYLAGLLQQYYSQVYLRIQTLREVDSDSEYRSIRSWQAPVGSKGNE